MDKNKNSGPATEKTIRRELRKKPKYEVPEPKLEEAKKEVKEAKPTKGRQKQKVSSTSIAAAAASDDGVSVTGGSGPLQPQNRLGHLKKIHFQRNSVEDLETLENVCELTHRGDTSLKLKELSFIAYGSVYFDVFPTRPFFKSNDMRVRAENVINRLLECNRNSLETIAWNPLTGLLGLKWPEVLPNVQKLTVSMVFDNVVSPNGFSWSTTFPKLRNVSLYLYVVMGYPGFTKSLKLLFGKQKVESVKAVHVHAGEGWSKRDPLIVAQFRQLKSIFPNAEIEISVPTTYFTAVSMHEKRCDCEC